MLVSIGEAFAVPSSPHDKLIKFTFSNLDRARSLLTYELPPPLVHQIDWTTLILERSSFIDEALSELHTDLLFSAQMIDGRRLFLYILVEHQSTVDPLMAFRIYRYVGRVWARFLRNEPGAAVLPAVYPIVLYHGAAPWSATREVRNLVDAPAGIFEPQIPKLSFVLDDLSQLPDEAIQNRPLEVFVKVALLALARLRQSPDAIADLERWMPFLRSLGLPPLVALFEYLNSVAEYEPGELQPLVRQLGEPAATAIMTAAERLKAEGRREGETGLLLRQFRLRFGELSPETERRVREAGPEELVRWSERLLTAVNLKDIFS